MARKKNDEFDFENSLTRLDQLVSQMESGDLSLEESLKNFEEGIGLVRNCQHALKEAEQKVQQLIEKNGQLELTPYENDTDK